MWSYWIDFKDVHDGKEIIFVLDFICLTLNEIHFNNSMLLDKDKEIE